MRLSVDPNDPGYQPLEVTNQYEITFNGEVIRSAVTADSDCGYLKAFVTDNGQYRATGDEIETRDYFGVVTIEKRA